MAKKLADRNAARRSGARVVDKTPGTAQGSARANTAPAARLREPHAGESSGNAANPREERARRAQEARERAENPDREDTTQQTPTARARARLGSEVAPADAEADTGDYESNQSTPSQQPTMLETKGGTEQPHPTMAPRAARSGAGLLPPPGRSHDRSIELAGTAPQGMRVRATAPGYYNHIRRREGDVFTLVSREGLISEPVVDTETGEQRVHPRTGEPMFRQVQGVLTPEEQFSDKWMEAVSDEEQETISTSRDAIRKRHDAILGGGARTVDRDVTEKDTD